MMAHLKEFLVTLIATSLLLPTAAIAKPADGTRNPKIVVYAKYPAKQRWHGYGFLPGYRQPPYIAEWRDRSVRHGGGYEPYERRYWNYDGQLSYGWGGPGFYRGQWNGGSFGPCWTWTPIGMIWNCGR